MNLLIAVLLALVLGLASFVSGVPDESIWSSFLAALVMLAGVIMLSRIGKQARVTDTSLTSARPFWRGAALPLGLLVAWALLSAGFALLSRHNMAFSGLMTRGWALLAMQFALFLLTRHLARSGRTPVWIVTIGLIAGAAIISAIGANEYVGHVRLGEINWRVFATSTPDFLAGYLVMLLPLTLAVFLSLQAGGAVSLLLGLIVALELGVMLTTGSRFALVSLLIGIAALGGTMGFALRRGLVLMSETRRRLLGLAAMFVGAGLLAAKPVLGRLLVTHAADNSAAFRVWTWRGAARMAWANPIFGTGIGTWAQTYPRYALTGFTRLAHNGYLQMADECGLVGLGLLVTVFVTVIVTVFTGLSHNPAPVPVPSPPATKQHGRAAIPVPAPPPVTPDVLPADSRWLQCGLLGSLAASITQNLIDSDWSVFFIGVSFWAIAGLAAGLTPPVLIPAAQASRTSAARTLAGIGAAALAAYFACQGTAALWGAAARTASTPEEAAADYQIAQAWDPLNASYPAALGYQVDGRTNNLPAAVMMLRRAVTLQPDGVNYRRLGTVLLAAGKRGDAEGAWERGLSAEPQSLDLLLALAQITPTPSNLAYYRTIARLELSPVGTVRAIGGLTEPKFAIADAALGDSLRAKPAEAHLYYTRAATMLEDYATEGGSTNIQRQAMQGSQTDPSQDIQMRALYAHVMDNLIALAPSGQHAALAQQQQATLAAFDGLLPKR